MSFNNNSTPVEAIWVDPVKLFPDPDQPRQRFEEKDLEALAASLERQGQIQPIVVRPLNTEGKYQIVVGERRWRAAVKKQLPNVLITVREIDDDEVLAVQMFENIGGGIRVPLDMRERANVLKRLVGKYGTQEKAAEAMGVSQAWISNNVAILELTPEAEELERDKIVKDSQTLIKLSRLAKHDKRAADDLVALAKEKSSLPRSLVEEKLREAGAMRTQKNKKTAAENAGAAAATPPAAPPPEANSRPTVNTPPAMSSTPSSPSEAQESRPKAPKREKVKKVTALLGMEEDADPMTLLDRLMDEYLRLAGAGAGHA